MFRLRLGKEGKKKIVNSIVDKVPDLLVEKLSSSFLVKLSDDEKLKVEKQKFEIEKEKLGIEREKLKIENKKLEIESITKVNNNLEVAEINARSRKQSAYWRSGTTIATAAIVGFFTYNYVKPSEEELKEAKDDLANKDKEIIKFRKLFISAQTKADMELKIRSEMERHLPKDVLPKIELFKVESEKEAAAKLNRYEIHQNLNEASNNTESSNNINSHSP